MLLNRGVQGKLLLFNDPIKAQSHNIYSKPPLQQNKKIEIQSKKKQLK